MAQFKIQLFNIGNDATDASGSIVKIDKNIISKSADKAISLENFCIHLIIIYLPLIRYSM